MMRKIMKPFRAAYLLENLNGDGSLRTFPAQKDGATKEEIDFIMDVRLKMPRNATMKEAMRAISKCRAEAPCEIHAIITGSDLIRNKAYFVGTVQGQKGVLYVDKEIFRESRLKHGDIVVLDCVYDTELRAFFAKKIF